MDKRNILMFAVYTLLVLAVASYYNKRVAQQQPRPTKTAQTVPTQETKETPVKQVVEASPEAVNRAPIADVTKTTSTSAQASIPEATEVISGPEKEIHIRSNLYDVTLNTRGARITSWKLLNYPEMPFLDPRLLDLQISQMAANFPEELSLEEARKKFTPNLFAYYETFLNRQQKLQEGKRFRANQGNRQTPYSPELALELVPQEGPEPRGTLILEKDGRPYDLNRVYATEQSEVVVDTTQTVILSVKNDEMEIRKTFTFFPNRYDCEFETQVVFFSGQGEENRGDLELVLTRSLGRYLDPPNSGRKGGVGQSAIVQVGNSMSKVPQAGQRLGYKKEFTGNINWVGMEDRYFISALVPKSKLESARMLTRGVEGTADVSLGIPVGYLAPRVWKTEKFQIFMGPKDTDLLAKLGAGVEKAVFAIGLLQWLHLSWICPFILWMLKALYKVIPNYGVGILLLSLLAKWVTYPLTIKQLRSMKKMQDLKPKMDEIRQKHQDDRAEMNKKVMEMYSQHGVNPMGGCWPMLLQMPIFIGLFMTINYSIQLRGEPFVLWIKDLSTPDALFYLPFPLPVFGFVAVNIIPLLNGLVTYFQQSKQVVDPQQATMMKIMPIFLTVLFWNFPSGVILYWTVMSLLQAVQQKLLDQPKHGG